jgi:hypothetical protein
VKAAAECSQTRAAGERDMQTAHSGCVKSAGVKWPAAGLSWFVGVGLIL